MSRGQTIRRAAWEQELADRGWEEAVEYGQECKLKGKGREEGRWDGRWDGRDEGLDATMGWVRRSNAQGGACERAERRVE